MKNLQKISFFLILLSFISCKKNEDEYLFDEDRFENIESLKLGDVIETEKEIGSRERTYNNTFGIGTSYYPNKNNFILSYPKVYEKEQENLKLETDYFYTPNDSLMKVIFYEWKSKSDTVYNSNALQSKAFKEKLINLKALISEKLGKPKVTEVDNHKWLENDLAANLYFETLGDFKRIRFVVYKK